MAAVSFLPMFLSLLIPNLTILSAPSNVVAHQNGSFYYMDTTAESFIYTDSTVSSLYSSSYSHVGSSMHIANMVLLWSRPQGTRPYRPQARRALSTCIQTLLLLLCGDVECNPDPPVISSNQSQRELRVGSLNANSAVNKTDLILSCIDEYQLDILAVTESYIRADHPTTIKNDPAPPLGIRSTMLIDNRKQNIKEVASPLFHENF